MNRRQLFQALAAAAIAPGELWKPQRTIFLPPRGGWLDSHGLFVRGNVGAYEVDFIPNGGIELATWRGVERVVLSTYPALALKDGDLVRLESRGGPPSLFVNYELIRGRS